MRAGVLIVADHRAGLADATAAAEASGKMTVLRALAAYGAENDSNGVLVGVQREDVPGSSARTLLNSDNTITVDFNPSLKGSEFAATLTHEGRHVADVQSWVSAGEPIGSRLDLNHYLREQRAWYVSSYIAEALGMKSYAPRVRVDQNIRFGMLDGKPLIARSCEVVVSIQFSDSWD